MGVVVVVLDWDVQSKPMFPQNIFSKTSWMHVFFMFCFNKTKTWNHGFGDSKRTASKATLEVQQVNTIIVRDDVRWWQFLMSVVIVVLS